jgi:hypothetical protein
MGRMTVGQFELFFFEVVQIVTPRFAVSPSNNRFGNDEMLVCCEFHAI